jgi:ribosomal protein S19E (S16A)
MGDTFVISGLKEKRSAIAGQIVDLKREIDKLQADLFHVDSVLRLYGLEPEEIPTKGRMPKRSAYFGRNEITRRCYEMLREKGAITADDVSVRAMQDKGLDPEVERKVRTDFTRRILVSLHDLRKAGTVEKVGHGRGVKWQLINRSDTAN